MEEESEFPREIDESCEGVCGAFGTLIIHSYNTFIMALICPLGQLFPASGPEKTDWRFAELLWADTQDWGQGAEDTGRMLLKWWMAAPKLGQLMILASEWVRGETRDQLAEGGKRSGGCWHEGWGTAGWLGP